MVRSFLLFDIYTLDLTLGRQLAARLLPVDRCEHAQYCNQGHVAEDDAVLVDASHQCVGLADLSRPLLAADDARGCGHVPRRTSVGLF